MNTLAVRSPMGNEHPAVSNYRRLKEGAPDTVRSIIIMCNSKFKFMGVVAAKRLFSEDEMNLYELGMGVNGDKTTKTALFCVSRMKTGHLILLLECCIPHYFKY